MESGHLHELRDKTLEEFDSYTLPDDVSDSEVDNKEVAGIVFI